MDPLFKKLDAVTVQPSLFSDVGFCTSGSVDPRLTKLLVGGGARQWNYAGDGVSHFISGNDVDEIKLEEAKDIFEIPIVSQRWILHSSTLSKLLPTHGFSGEIKQLFSSVVVTTSGITGPDLKSIAAIISYHGGSFCKVLSSNSTHLITNQCSGKKYVTAKEKQVAVVSADWVLDSVKAGRLLDVMIYDPGLLSILQVKKETTDHLNSRTESRPPSTSTTRVIETPTESAFSNKSSSQESCANVEQQSSLAQSQFQSNKFDSSNQGYAKKPILQREEVQVRNPTVGSQSEFVTNGQYAQQTYASTPSQRLPRPPVPSTLASPQTSISNQRLQSSEPMTGRLQPASMPRTQFQVGLRPTSIPQWTQQQQLEIIRQIQSDPLIKQQWALMDHQQRTLLIQKLAQRNREEHLRREMMLRQQQMNQQMNLSCVQRQNQILDTAIGIQPSGNPPEHGGNISQLHNSPVSTHMQLTQNQNVFLSQLQSQSSPPVATLGTSQDQKSLGQPSQNVQQMMTSRLIQNRDTFGMHKAPGNIAPQSGFNHAAAVVPLNDGPAGERLYVSQTNEQHKEPSPAQSKEHMLPQHPQVLAHGQMGGSPDQLQQQVRDSSQSGMHQLVDPARKSEESMLSQIEPHSSNQFFGSGSVSTQGQIMSPHHQVRASLRMDQKLSPSGDMIHGNRFETQQPPGPLTSQPKYFPSNQNSMEAQATHSPTSGLGGPLNQGCGIVRTQHIFTPQLSQQRLNVRHVILPQGQQQHHIILQPQTSPARSPIISQKLLLPPPSPQPQTTQSGLQWSPTGKTQQQPLTADPISQHWSIRSPSQHQTNVVYTGNQSTMPFAQVVNSKTKTALANLLSNRQSMGSSVPEPNISGNHILPRSPSPLQNLPSPVPLSQSPSKPGPQIPTSSAQQNAVLQRRTVTNSLTSGAVQVMNPNTGRATPGQPQPPPLSYVPTRAQFFAHDPNVKLPPDGFLLGCIFWAAQPVPVKHWEIIVYKYGGEIETSYSARVSHVLCKTQKFPEFQQSIRDGKRLVTVDWLSDVCTRKCVTTPFYATHLPVPFSESEKPLQGEHFSTTGFLGEDLERVKLMCNYLGAEVTSYFSKAHIAVVALKASGPKFEAAREWKKPVVNVQFLNELMFGHSAAAQLIHSPKYQQFNMDQPFRFDIAMVAPLLASWKVPIRVSNDAFEKYSSRKCGTYPAEETEPQAKRQKMQPPEDFDQLFSAVPHMTQSSVTEHSGETKPVVVTLSGFPIALKEVMKQKVEYLKGRMTDDVKEATHLIIREQCLTKKLFIGVTCLSAVVTLSWLQDSFAQGRFIDATPYILEPYNSGEYGISYSRILKSPNRHILFSELTFYVTPSVPIYHSDLVEIIRASGGHIDKQNSLSKVFLLARESPDKYMVVSCTEDDFLIKKWKTGSGKELVILNRDTILEWILRQEVRLPTLS